MLRETQKVMIILRLVNKSLGVNGARIDTWVDQYLDEYRMLNKIITILTPWSISPRLIDRYKIQGNNFLPTINEEKLFRKDIPYILSVFYENGFKVNWWIYFSRSYLDETMLDINLEVKYIEMIRLEKEKHNISVEIINWEDDVIGKRYYPNELVFKEFEKFVNHSLFQQELERRTLKWIENSSLTKKQIEIQTKYKIACEAEEGRTLIKENLFDSSGKFLFVPVGVPEKYNFFSILVQEFKRRLVFILKPYPWRL
jgi:hypothetical protein